MAINNENTKNNTNRADMKTLTRNETLSLITQLKWSRAPLSDGIKIFGIDKKQFNFTIRTKEDLENSRCKAYKLVIK